MYRSSWFRFPSGTQIFSLSHARDTGIFHLSHFFPSFKKLPIFLFIITHGAFDIADPRNMQDACFNELSKYDLACHESSRSPVVRAPDRCMGGRGFVSRRGLIFFCLSHACVKLNIPSSLTMCSSRENPYLPMKGRWKFLGGRGLKTQNFGSNV